MLDIFARSEAGGLVSTSWHAPYCDAVTCHPAGFSSFVEHNIPVRNSPTAVAQANWGRVMVLISDSYWQQSWVNYFSRGGFNYDWSYFGNEWATTPAPWSRGSDDHAIGRKADGSLWDIWVGANSSTALWQTATASPTLVQSGTDAFFYTAKDASTSYQRIYRSEYRFH